MSYRNASYSKVNLFIRSSIFSVLSLASILLYSPLMVCIRVLPLRQRFPFIRFFMRNYMRMLKFVCHIDYHVEGLDNIPKDRNGIIMCKHQSTWETFYLPIIFHDPAAIAKRELLRIPFFGWGFAASEPIAINRSDVATSMQQVIAQGTECLAAGRWIMLFPEGTRVAAGAVGNYRLGGARLAAATGAPIVPVAHNAGRFWPRRTFIKRPGTIQVVIGPVIESTGRTPEEILELTKDWIESTMLHIDSRVDKATSQ